QVLVQGCLFAALPAQEILVVDQVRDHATVGAELGVLRQVRFHQDPLPAPPALALLQQVSVRQRLRCHEYVSSLGRAASGGLLRTPVARRPTLRNRMGGPDRTKFRRRVTPPPLLWHGRETLPQRANRARVPED